MAGYRSLLCVFLLVAAGLQESSGKVPESSKRQLKRSTGKRWDSIHEVVRAEIKSATKHFLESRSRALVLPLEVDILLIGFDGDGGYGYRLDRQALEELLGSATDDNTVCPTVWETGEHAAVCFAINYLLLDSARSEKAIERIEEALLSNMEWVGDRSQDWPDGSRDVAVYEVEANGEVEAVVWDLLDEAYGGSQRDLGRSQHSQIVVVNPSKRRMRPGLPPPPHHHNPAAGGGAAGEPSSAELLERYRAAARQSGPGLDFMAEWKKGAVNASAVVDQEAAFLYRYRYGGRGGAAAVVSQYNFLLLDVAAGPTAYGPLASAGGAVAPTALPRLMPMLLRMTSELEQNPQFGTYRTYLLDEAARGASALFAGSLASAVAAASRHLFAADLRLAGAEALAGGPGGQGAAKRVVVPIMILQDHDLDLYGERGGPSRGVDTDLVQLALDELLPPEVAGAVSVTRHMLHHHRALAAALVKARHTRSAAVLTSPPDTGLHRSHTVAVDAGALLAELRAAAADTDAHDSLLGSLGPELEEAMAGDYSSRLHEMDDPEAFLEGRRHSTKVLPVFVFSLARSPDQMMFDDGGLLAADAHAVAVLQLLGGPDDPSRGRVYSGHMLEGHHLLTDAAESPTRSVVAGLATALGGLVPPHARHCGASEGGLAEDWRWAVGAVPWGPYSNYSIISSIFGATSRRNLLVARIERPLRQLIRALNELDDFIAQHLQGPFAALSRPAILGSGNEFGSLVSGQHRLLDLLAKHHVRYHNASKSAVRSLLGGGGGRGDRAPSPTRPSPSPSPADPAHHPPAHEGAGHAGASGHGGPGHDDGDGYDGGDGGGFVHDLPGGFSVSSADEHFQADHPERGAGTGAGAGSKHRSDGLVAEQEALSPDVADRLRHALEDIGEKLEAISFHMYSRSWAELDDALPSLEAAIEAFDASASRDLAHAAEVVGCCALTHGSAGAGTWFILAVLLTALGGFGIIACTAIRSQRLYAPGSLPRAGSGGGGATRGPVSGLGGSMGSLGSLVGISRHSSSRSMRTTSGLLPEWVGPQDAGGLPR